MPLKLKKYPKQSKNYYVRGTIAGISVFESTGTANRAEAEAYRVKLEQTLWRQGALGEQPPATFADAVLAYLDRDGEGRFVKRLLDYFKETPLTEIGQREIDRCAHDLYPEAKNSTRVRQVYGPMVAILNAAVDAELPGAVPKRIKSPKIDKVPPKWVNDDYIDRILPHCNPRLKAIVLVMTYTGLRIGEVLDRVPADFTMRPGWMNVGKTKNGEPAFVPLPEETQQAVRAVLPASGPAFGYTTLQGVNRALRTAAKRAGVDYVSCHKIGRHTFAARLLNEGYDIKTVKEAGRWKKLAVVDEIYGHLEIRRTHDIMVSVAQRRCGKETENAKPVENPWSRDDEEEAKSRKVQ